MNAASELKEVEIFFSLFFVKVTYFNPKYAALITVYFNS